LSKAEREGSGTKKHSLVRDAGGLLSNWLLGRRVGSNQIKERKWSCRRGIHPYACRRSRNERGTEGDFGREVTSLHGRKDEVGNGGSLKIRWVGTSGRNNVRKGIQSLVGGTEDREKGRKRRSKT